jgi:hypothetical protein
VPVIQTIGETDPLSNFQLVAVHPDKSESNVQFVIFSVQKIGLIASTVPFNCTEESLLAIDTGFI